MATAQTFISELNTKLLTLSTPLSVDVERLPLDYTNQNSPDAGDLGYKIRVHQVSTEAIDSANTVNAIEAEVDFVWRSTDFDSSRTFSDDTMLTLQATILDRNWWRALSSVREFWSNGVLQVGTEPTLVGKVFTFTVTAQVVLVP